MAMLMYIRMLVVSELQHPEHNWSCRRSDVRDFELPKVPEKTTNLRLLNSSTLDS